MRLTRHTNTLAFLGMATTLCLLELTVARSALYTLNIDLLSLVVTVDLTLGIPFLYYLLLVRPRRIPAITLAPIFVLGVALAYLILPSDGQVYLDRIRALAILLEVGAMFYLLKSRDVFRHYRRLRPNSVYASDALDASIQQVFGANRAARMLATELSIPYYLVAGWFRKFKNTHPTDIPFTTHRKSGYGLVIAMLSGLILLETIGLHIIVAHWSPLIAWILTSTSIYALLWVVGHYQSVRLHPIVISERGLHIRNGFRWRIDVDWTNLADVRRVTHWKSTAPDYLNASIYGEPRIILQLKQPVTAYGLFGSQKQVSEIGIRVDDETLFQSELGKRMLN